MNLFKPGRRAYFRAGLYVFLGVFLRILLVVSLAAAVAAIVNLRHTLIEEELKIGLGVMLLLLGSTVMHILYALGVSAVYRWMLDGRDRRPSVKNRVLYVVTATLPVVFVNLLLLQILVFPDLGFIFMSSYWVDDFPFFFVPLLLYIIALLYWPAARLYIRRDHVDKEAQARDYLHAWTTHRRTFFLLSYLNMVYGAEVLHGEDGVRVMDIVFIYYEERCYYFILRDGTKVKARDNSKSIAQWRLAGWFVSTTRWTYFNMLYIQMPNVGDKYLKLVHSVKHKLKKSDQFSRINLALQMNRKLEPELNAFALNRESLPVEGWDEMIAL